MPRYHGLSHHLSLSCHEHKHRPPAHLQLLQLLDELLAEHVHTRAELLPNLQEVSDHFMPRELPQWLAGPASRPSGWGNRRALPTSAHTEQLRMQRC